jgi:hypothetical protein
MEERREPPSILAELMAASREADEAGDRLAVAKARFTRIPDAASREQVRELATEALRREMRFQSLWEKSASELLKKTRS